MKNSDFELGFLGRSLAVLCFFFSALLGACALAMLPFLVGLAVPYTRAVFAVPLVFFVGAWKVARFGLRLRSLNAAALMQKDRRPTVLYLRSFEQDDLLEDSESAFRRGADEQLLSALHFLGPVIAIGKPTQKIPPLGAARIKMKAADWQAQARELMEGSQLLVLRSGFTEELLWEFGETSRLSKPKPVLICAPIPQEDSVTNTQQQFERFKRALAKSFPSAAAALPDQLANTGYFFFDSSGQMTEFPTTQAAHLEILERLQPGLKLQAANKMKKKQRLVWIAVALIFLYMILGYVYVSMHQSA
jgi:hypothetical protein